MKILRYRISMVSPHFGELQVLVCIHIILQLEKKTTFMVCSGHSSSIKREPELYANQSSGDDV